MDTLTDKVYRELRALAGSYFRGQPAGMTLSPTALAGMAVAVAGVALVNR